MVKIGIIGLGRIGTIVHIPGLKKTDAKITAVCDIDEDKLKQVGDELGIPEDHRFTDYKKLIACADVDAVEICTPNNLHVPMAVDVVKAGKAVEIEKPIGISYEQAKELETALAKNPVPNMTCMSYRFIPAVRYAKWIMDRGLLGTVVDIEVQYLQQGAFWEGRRLEWRFDKNISGSGAIGDLGIHLLDLATFLGGDMHSVCSQTRTVVKERMKLDSDEYVPVTVDDYASFIGRLGNDIMVSFMVTRCALGHDNTIKFDVYGTDGVLSFDLNNPNMLGVCVGELDKKSRALHFVKVPAEFYVDQEPTFIKLCEGTETEHLPKVKDAIKLQKVLDAILLSSEERRWVDLD